MKLEEKVDLLTKILKLQNQRYKSTNQRIKEKNEKDSEIRPPMNDESDSISEMKQNPNINKNELDRNNKNDE